ncbi:hypothetical protein [Paenibacillus spongiae]|uniref:Uncharacterized protein n=1 Tax=Paenibacillus spongiae TaxID=2909671 RepID=A0ABY5S2E2_9BACL|nr:hypothetical protein [Paenibacillus spongiae]UVI27829.1 hypothetical protein L1F29_20475 [Paenibacillus spongiae]
MGERIKNSYLVVLYSFGAGLMLAIFPFINSPANLIFSLLALVIGIYFFKRFPGIGMRIIFFVVSILFFLIITIIITMVMYVRTNPPIA